MVQGKWFAPGTEFDAPLSIRKDVFGRGKDALDSQAWQVLVCQDKLAVGSARLWWADGRFVLGDVGVPEKERGRGYGDLLVRLLLFKALTHGAGTIALNAPANVAPFFARYGFQAEAPEGDGILMTIQGKDVQLSHCGGNCAECDHPSQACAPKALR